jgi:phosphopantothenoylcysteine decarboxylase/phosphopantothenate--cysteine ligase
MMGTGILSGKRIVIGVTGSIAAVETVRLAHALRREGAEVTAVMTDAATRIIHPDALTYATGHDAITSLSGRVEHVAFCGDDRCADLLLIAPCTANTLCKIAGGIDDTPVTTFASTALGSGMPVVVVPAMHESMYRHPGVTDCIRRLSSWNVRIIPPRIEEGKAKIAAIGEIVLWCGREIPESPLAGKHILITSGPCREPVDSIRVMTTRSTGRMGRELALQAFRLGAEVTVVHSGMIPCVRNITVETAQEMRDAVHRICADRVPDLYISAAAISDFAPEYHKGKLRSGQALTLTLHPLPKLIDEVISRYGIPVIAFKLGDEEEERAEILLDKGASLVVMNRPEAMGSDTTDAVISGSSGREQVKGTKRELAERIWERVLSLSCSWGWHQG